MKNLPFSFVPFKLLKKIKSRFYGLAHVFDNLFPEQELKLKQTGMDIGRIDYIALCFSSFFYNYAFFLAIIYVTTVIVNLEALFGLIISLISALAVAVLAFFVQLYYPTVKAGKKRRNIKKNLLFALRDMLVRLKSGVPVYEAMVGVSKEDFGIVSEEFKKTTMEIEKGKSQLKALEDMALRNPSKDFRRVIWQINNSIRSGADVADTISTMVRNLSREQLIEVRNYGNQLSPIAMMYMMVSVIMPTLGITFIIILSSFLGFKIPKMAFYGITVMIIMFQFVFYSLIKSRRPPVGV